MGWLGELKCKPLDSRALHARCTTPRDDVRRALENHRDRADSNVLHITGPDVTSVPDKRFVSTSAARPLLDVTEPEDDGVFISDVWKAFGSKNNGHSVLEDINLRIRRGQFVTFIGPSGCGKSTLLRIIAGLLTPDRGSVSICGETVSQSSQSKRIGFVPQSPSLLPWRTVIDNVELALRINRNGIHERNRRPLDPRELLEKFGLGDVLNLRPNELSGGMQQRVAIARAFVFDPMVLLMDEPFSALDEFARESQRHGLLEHWQTSQKTVLFVTHSVTEAVELSDVIVVMSSRPGRVRKVITVDLPRPRHSFADVSEAFHMVEAEVRRALSITWSPSE